MIAQVTDAGKIECLYHGWQFDGSDGACTRIPQVCSTLVGEVDGDCTGDCLMLQCLLSSSTTLFVMRVQYI